MKKGISLGFALLLILLSCKVSLAIRIVELQGHIKLKKEKGGGWEVIQKKGLAPKLEPDDVVLTTDRTTVVFLIEEEEGTRYFKMGPNAILKISEIISNPPMTDEEFLVMRCLSTIPTLDKGLEEDSGILDVAGGVRGKALKPSPKLTLRHPHLKKKAIQLELRRFNGARDLFKNHLYENAIRRYLMFISKHPKSLLLDDAQFQIGESLRKLGRYKTAIKEYKSLISMYPKSLWRERARRRIADLEKRIR
jgi:tetratricopeptide (TPR) repeat protein